MITKTKNNEFHISTDDTSYIIRVMPTGHIEQLYYGRKISEADDYAFLYDEHGCGYGTVVCYSQTAKTTVLDNICLEYSSYGKGDYREPAIRLQSDDGCFISDFKFSDFRITDGKPELAGLPSSYGDDCQTLTLILEDKALGAKLELNYTAFSACNVIARSANLINESQNSIKIHSIMSSQLDLPKGKYVMMTFDGTWLRERCKSEKELVSGEYSVGSITGISSNRHNPFFVVRRDDCTEQNGECYGFNLVYSGNHIARAEVSPMGIVRIQNGINPFEFEWTLAPGENFYTPEAVLTFSYDGLNKMSQNMHSFVQNHIVRGKWKFLPRPILVNNWEATCFFYTEKRILSIAREAKNLGAELFVLDDGWFGKRNSDKKSLGDWTVNKTKLPHGIDGLAKRVNEMGLKFGLWVEPEMVSPDSDLYRSHPDWAILSDKYEASQGRNQLVLDLTRPEVREYLINVFTGLFGSANIEYVKWDMNRYLSDMYSRGKDAKQGEIFHRYILGLYEILKTLTERFPDILFESCASGGNRFDLGMLCYMPQIWTSDDTDSLERLYIQGGTSYGYPQSVMAAHVSTSPSMQVLRPSSIENRFNVAGFGILGYELDITNLSPSEKAVVKRQIEYYKEHRQLLQFGTIYRIGDLAKENECMWQVVSENKKESIIGFFVNRGVPNPPADIIRAEGLDEGALYELSARVQLLSLKTFGDMINVPLPIKMTIDGTVHNTLAEVVRLHTEKENYRIAGSSLMYAGFKPKQRFNCSGYNKDTRVITDSDSRLYYLKSVDENIED